MSSSFDTLVETLTRYQAGTEKFLEWLTGAVDEAERGGKLNGARMLARKLKPRVKRGTVDELPILARIVVEAEPRVSIPLEMLDVAKDVINLRKWCGDFYSSLPCHPDKKEAERIASLNATHRHFLTRFEEVFAILKQEAKKRQPKRKKAINLAADSDDLSNLFLHLELEEPAASADLSSTSNATRIAHNFSAKSRTRQPVHTVAYDLEGDEDFAIKFTALSLLRDLHDLRLSVMAVWKKHALGEISHPAACQITEHAVQACMAISTTFHDQNKSVASFLDVVNLVGEDIYTLGLPTAQVGISKDSSNTSSSVVLCTPAWTTLLDISRHAKLFRNQESNVIMQTDDNVAISSSHPFAKTLLSILPDLLEILELSDSKRRSALIDLWPFADEYTQQLGKFIYSPHWNAGFVAATQLLMDIFEYFPKDIDRYVGECEAVLDQVSTKAIGYIEWNHKLDAITKENTSPQGPGLLEKLRHIVVPHCTDKRGRDGWMVKLNLTPNGLEDEPCFISRQVLKALPILPGHLAWKLRLIAHRTEIAICNSRHVILAAAHIHNATKLLHSPVHDWNELDSVVAQQESYLRQGDGSVRSAAKHYGMAIGLSLTAVNSRSRPEMPSTYTTAHKSKSLIPASHIGAQESLVMHDGSLKMSTIYEAVRIYANECTIKDEIIAKQWKATKRLTPGQLPIVLTEMVLRDEKRVFFDYLGLSQRCVEILREVTTALPLQQSKALSSRSLRRQYSYQQVYDIFWDAAGIETRELPLERSPLFAASKCITAALQKHNMESSKASTEAEEVHGSIHS